MAKKYFVYDKEYQTEAFDKVLNELELINFINSKVYYYIEIINTEDNSVEDEFDCDNLEQALEAINISIKESTKVNKSINYRITKILHIYTIYEIDTETNEVKIFCTEE